MVSPLLLTTDETMDLLTLLLTKIVRFPYRVYVAADQYHFLTLVPCT